MCRCGTWGHGLAGMGVLGGWLDLMILEVFSNLNDSMSLWIWADCDLVACLRAVTRLAMFFTPRSILHKSWNSPGNASLAKEGENSTSFSSSFFGNILSSVRSLSSCINPQYWYCNGLGPSSELMLWHWVDLPAGLNYWQGVA